MPEGKPKTAAQEIAVIVMEQLEKIYSVCVATLPDGPAKDDMIARWGDERDDYKPRLEAIIRTGRPER